MFINEELGYMSVKMKEKIYILLMGILALLIIIIFLVIGKIQPEGEYITKSEMIVLTELLNTVWNEHIAGDGENTDSIQKQKETMVVLQEMVSDWEVEEYVTYGQFVQWRDEINSGLDELGNEEIENTRKYRKKSFFDKEDLFAYFDKVCDVIDPENEVTTEQLLVLGDSSNVVDIEGKPVEEDYVFTQRGRWGKKLAPEYIPTQQSASYITYQGMLWGVYRIEPSATLFNAWIIENTEKDIIYFYKNYKITEYGK